VEDPRQAERVRIAAELHGGLLQEFTAAGFELKRWLDAAGPDGRPAIARARDILLEQQRRLRDYVTQLRTEPADEHGLSLAETLEAAIAALQRQSGGRLGWDARPHGVRIPRHEMLQLRLLLADAVGEVIRQHGAAEIMVSVELDRTLRLTLTHDGHSPIVSAAAAFDARLHKLGGTCRRLASAVGGALHIELPRT
jgi:signal transduction histidine kinase